MQRPHSTNDDHHDQSESGSTARATEFSHLLERAKRGEPSAVNQLYQLSQKYLLLIANQNLDPKMLQKFGASDMVQQSMLVANQKMDAFQGETRGEFLAWMRQILLNECRHSTRGFQQTEKRDINREQGLTSPHSESRQPQVADQFLTPSSEAANKEQMQLVAEVLDTLPELDRRVIKMRNWEELSFEEIGEAIDKSADAARKIWSRAIMKLESELRRKNAI